MDADISVADSASWLVNLACSAEAAFRKSRSRSRPAVTALVASRNLEVSDSASLLEVCSLECVVIRKPTAFMTEVT